VSTARILTVKFGWWKRLEISSLRSATETAALVANAPIHWARVGGGGCIRCEQTALPPTEEKQIKGLILVEDRESLLASDEIEVQA